MYNYEYETFAWKLRTHWCHNFVQGPAVLSWSCGCWISSYLCNQSLSPLMLWVRIQLRRVALNTTLCYQVCQWLGAGRGFSPGNPVYSTCKTDPPRYNWNIVESANKHHKANYNFVHFCVVHDHWIASGTHGFLFWIGDLSKMWYILYVHFLCLV